MCDAVKTWLASPACLAVMISSPAAHGRLVGVSPKALTLLLSLRAQLVWRKRHERSL